MNKIFEVPLYPYTRSADQDAVTPAHHRVVIVGAGPVGLAAAIDLAQQGIEALVVDENDKVSFGSRAICFAKRTLEIADRLGCGAPLVDKGVQWNIGKVFFDDRKVYDFNLLPEDGHKRPAFINLQQYYFEDYLVKRAREIEAAGAPLELRGGNKVTAVSDRGDHVDLQIDTPEGPYTITADYIIACDGAASPIRSMMGLDFVGRVFEDNFLIADVKCAEERPSERWFWFDPPFNGAGSALLHKQPDEVWRLDFQLGWDIDREAAIRPENVEPFVRAMLGDNVEFAEEWYSVYTFQCRRMRRFVHDRVIFAGDSAHLVSPFGARGCNGGVADADNLAWKLDAVLNGEADARLIESYNEEAIVTADENILNSTRSTDFMTPKSAVSAAFRDAVLDLAGDHPFARAFVNSGRLSTPVSYPHSALSTADCDPWQGGVAPGSPAVDAALDDGWLLDQLGGGFALLSYGATARIEGVRTIELMDQPGNGAVLERYALQPGCAYLFRPDQYVAARWYNPSQVDVSRALATATGRPCHAFS